MGEAWDSTSKYFRPNTATDKHGRENAGRRGYSDDHDGLDGRVVDRPRWQMPAGYHRPDDRIRDDVCEALARSDLDISRVSVDVDDAVVTLSGGIATRAERTRVEQVVTSIFGVTRVTNQIRVEGGDSRTPGGESDAEVETDDTGGLP